MAQDQRSSPWSDLPPELLGLVFLRLPTRADRAFFSAVCRMWCSVARQRRLPSPSPLPWLVLPGGNIISFPHGETLQLPEGVRYHNSCGEWLLLSRDDDSCFLMNVFTKATMPLPSLYSYSYYQDPVEVAEDLMAQGHEYWINGMFRSSQPIGTWLDHKGFCVISVLSLVVCSARLIAAIFAVGGFGTIALCRPGAAAWSVSAHERCRKLSGMVFFQGKLYALDGDSDPEYLINIGIVDEPDSDEPRVSRIECVIHGDFQPLGKYFYPELLVESHGRLLMVRRKLSIGRGSGFPSMAIKVPGSSEFEVFEADFEQALWSGVSTLGNDQALFLG